MTRDGQPVGNKPGRLSRNKETMAIHVADNLG